MIKKADGLVQIEQPDEEAYDQRCSSHQSLLLLTAEAQPQAHYRLELPNGVLPFPRMAQAFVCLPLSEQELDHLCMASTSRLVQRCSALFHSIIYPSVNISAFLLKSLAASL